MSERHPVLPIAALSNRHPGITPAISAGDSGACALGAIGLTHILGS